MKYRVQRLLVWLYNLRLRFLYWRGDDWDDVPVVMTCNHCGNDTLHDETLVVTRDLEGEDVCEDCRVDKRVGPGPVLTVMVKGMV